MHAGKQAVEMVRDEIFSDMKRRSPAASALDQNNGRRGGIFTRAK